MAKLSIGYVRSVFEKEGYKLFTTECQSKMGLLDYKCPEGHDGSIRWSIWQQGSRCKECASKKFGDHRRLFYGEVKQRIESAGYKLLSKEYENNVTNLELECPNYHVHLRTFGDFSKGSRCPECNIVRQRTPIEVIKKSFGDAGYVLLTTEYKNSRQKLDYICPKGHQHIITWQSWNLQQARCNICAQEIIKAFEAEEYKLLTTKYKNQDTPLDYECPKGHKFTTKWDYWYMGGRCPQCYLDKLKGRITSQWHWLVKEKDGYKCVLCGSDKNLHAHHLYSKLAYPHLKHDLANGVTLCYWHHKGSKNSFHSIFGSGDNTKKQFEDYVQMYFAGLID